MAAQRGENPVSPATLSMPRSLHAAVFSPSAPLETALRQAGFPETELQALRDTRAMAKQLSEFAQAGGHIERVDADFAGANGRPGLIRFYCPPAPQACTHSGYGVLAHELGHALLFPEQWLPPTHFADARGYARARELGEAHAWLNQYRLCTKKVGGLPEVAPVLPIENPHDFGSQPVDIFGRIAERQAAGWSDARTLDELAVLSAHMFPCGMGVDNLKTYGQCDHWDWLKATESRHPTFMDFLQRLGRAPTPHEQKLLTKRHVFIPTPGDGRMQAAWGKQAVIDLATALREAPGGDLAQLWALAQDLSPCEAPDKSDGCRVAAIPTGAPDSIATRSTQAIVTGEMP